MQREPCRVKTSERKEKLLVEHKFNECAIKGKKKRERISQQSHSVTRTLFELPFIDFIGFLLNGKKRKGLKKKVIQNYRSYCLFSFVLEKKRKNQKKKIQNKQ